MDRPAAYKTCWYCRMPGLRWGLVEEGKWRLFNPDGMIHNCQGYYKRLEEMQLAMLEEEIEEEMPTKFAIWTTGTASSNLSQIGPRGTVLDIRPFDPTYVIDRCPYCGKSFVVKDGTVLFDSMTGKTHICPGWLGPRSTEGQPEDVKKKQEEPVRRGRYMQAPEDV